MCIASDFGFVLFHIAVYFYLFGFGFELEQLGCLMLSNT